MCPERPWVLIGIGLILWIHIIASMNLSAVWATPLKKGLWELFRRLYQLFRTLGVIEKKNLVLKRLKYKQAILWSVPVVISIYGQAMFEHGRRRATLAEDIVGGGRHAAIGDLQLVRQFLGCQPTGFFDGDPRTCQLLGTVSSNPFFRGHDRASECSRVSSSQ